MTNVKELLITLKKLQRTVEMLIINLTTHLGKIWRIWRRLRSCIGTPKKKLRLAHDFIYIKTFKPSKITAQMI